MSQDAEPAPHAAVDMYQIDINDAQSRETLDLERLRQIAEDVLSREGVAAAEVSVALIDGETMRRLNRQHLGHDYDTDVLSFLLECEEPDQPSAEAPRGQGKRLEGEVLLSTDIAAKAAAEFGWSVENEVILYLVHGLLHLVGYDDLSESEKQIMRQRERFHLAHWGLEPVYAEDDGTIADVADSSVSSRDLPFGVRG